MVAANKLFLLLFFVVFFLCVSVSKGNWFLGVSEKTCSCICFEKTAYFLRNMVGSPSAV